MGGGGEERVGGWWWRKGGVVGNNNVLRHCRWKYRMGQRYDGEIVSSTGI